MKKSKRAEIEEVVIRYVADAAGRKAEEISLSQNLFMDLEMDSLALFETAVDLEMYYDIRISDEVLDHIETVGDIVDYLEKIKNNPEVEKTSEGEDAEEESDADSE